VASGLPVASSITARVDVVPWSMASKRVVMGRSVRRS